MASRIESHDPFPPSFSRARVCTSRSCPWRRSWLPAGGLHAQPLTLGSKDQAFPGYRRQEKANNLTGRTRRPEDVHRALATAAATSDMAEYMTVTAWQELARPLPRRVHRGRASHRFEVGSLAAFGGRAGGSRQRCSGGTHRQRSLRCGLLVRCLVSPRYSSLNTCDHWSPTYLQD